MSQEDTSLKLGSPANNKPCTIISANIQGLYNRNGRYKLKMLSEISSEENACIIALTESHLKEEIKDAEIKITGYDHFRSDRHHNKKGGVIVYIKDELKCIPTIVMSESVGNIETLVLHLKKLSLMLVVIYRPPTAESEDFQNTMRMVKSCIIENTLNLPLPNIILTGDLNLPMIQWENQLIVGGTTDLKKQCDILLDISGELFMTQLVKEPTREQNILDLLLTNNEDIFLYIKMQDTVMSDHRLIICGTRIESYCTNPKVTPTKWNSLNFFSENIDWQIIREKLGLIKWTELLEGESCTATYNIVLNTIFDAVESLVPPKKPRHRSLIPRDRKILMRRRTKVRRKIEESFTESSKYNLKQELIEIERQIVSSHQAEALGEENLAVSRIKSNSKYFYKYAKIKSILKTSVGPFIIDDELVEDPHRKASELLKQYNSVHSSQPYSLDIVDTILSRPGASGLDNVEFTEVDIMESIRSLSNTSAPGPDGVPPILLKECCVEISTALLLIWTKSLDEHKIPEDLKKGIVIPIYKGGDKSLPKNYRPVTLTSHIVKIFEKIIIKRITDYLSSINVWNVNQHGFRRGRSCLSQLLEHYQQIIDGLEDGSAVDVVYLDFSKAFDKVDHNILLDKLSSIGISRKLLQWIGSFLIGRKHAVLVDGHTTDYSDVGSGVPQGSVLGPLLFLIYIADIDRGLSHVTASCFADDTRLLMRRKNDSEKINMQADIDSVYQWAEQNRMCFNESKFVHLKYKHPKVVEMTDSCYHAGDGNIITTEMSTKDLGVQVCNSTNFQLQINEVSTKGHRQCGWILRTFITRQPGPMITLFKGLVLPLVEYCCQLWSPTSLAQIRKIEAVQRNFTSRISNIGDLNYWQRLDRLGLYSLERRRERYIVIYIFKILSGVVPNMTNEGYQISTYNNARRGLLCRIPPISTGAMAKFKSMKERSFAVRGPMLFNSIPADIRNLELSVDSFKAKLDKFLGVIPDKPSLPNYAQTAQSNSILEQLSVLRREGIYL